MGLSLLGNTIEKGSYKAPVPGQAIKDTYNFRHLLRHFAGHVAEGTELTEHKEKYLQRLAEDCSNYLQTKAFNCPSYTQVVSTLTDIIKKSSLPQVGSDGFNILSFASDTVMLCTIFIWFVFEGV